MKYIKKIISIALTACTVSLMVAADISVSAASLKKPTNLQLENCDKSVKVSWNKVTGAKKYTVYRGNKAIKTTSKTSYKDYSVTAGKKYTYKIKAVNGYKTSKFSLSASITRMSNTAFKSVTNGDGCVNLSWLKRSGANRYRIYRKTTGKYSFLKRVADTSYTDDMVVSGTKYTYKIACYNTETKTASKKSSTKSITYLDKVTDVFARENTDGKSIMIKWSPVNGAASYNIQRKKAGDSSYITLASTASTAYIDTQLVNNPTAYRYKITAVKKSSVSADSDSPVTAYLPIRDGVNSFWHDENNNLHLSVILNKDDVYSEIKSFSDFYSLAGLYSADITSGEDVITLNGDVITAVKEGKAVVEVKITDTVLDFVNAIGTQKAQDYYDRAVKKTIYYDIEVIETTLV